MSVLSPQRVIALWRDLRPAGVLAFRDAFGEPGKRRQNDEVVDRQQDSADGAGERAGQAQICFPESGQARLPETPAVALGRDANELGERVVHMKHLVAENLVKDALCGRIGSQYVAIDGESAGGGFFGDVEKSQHRAVGLLIDLQVVEAMPA